MKKTTMVLSAMMFMGILILSGVSQGVVTPSVVSPLSGRILYVGGSGPGNYSKIQDAVDNASDGDTVFVYNDSAPYYEDVAIHAAIRLIGENRETTIIEGVDYAVSLYADGVTVSGFRINVMGDFWNCCGFNVMSNGNTISDNAIVNNRRMVGISLNGSSYDTVSGNIIENNLYHGIRVQYGSHDMIVNNTIVNDQGYGISVWESTDDVVAGNMVQQCSLNGLIVEGNSSNCSFYHNTLINNSENAYDSTPGDVWDTGSSGNYWSDYNGSDLNHDGIGDTPYDVPGNESVDRYPLMEPYGVVEQPPLLVTIKGGFGIAATVKNLGNWDAIRVDWLSTLLGGYFVRSSLRYQSGTLPLVTPGQEVVVMKTRHLFGVGLMNVVVNVGTATAFQRGFLLGVIYLPLPPA
jgi:parallel beta-helix repeat protein